MEREATIMTKTQTLMFMQLKTPVTQKNIVKTNNDNRNNCGGGRGNQGCTSGECTNIHATYRKYCYTHSACVHTGQKCNTPEAGHKPEATF